MLIRLEVCCDSPLGSSRPLVRVVTLDDRCYTRSQLYRDKVSDTMTALMMLSLITFLSLSCMTNSADAPSPLLTQCCIIMFFRYTVPARLAAKSNWYDITRCSNAGGQPVLYFTISDLCVVDTIEWHWMLELCWTLLMHYLTLWCLFAMFAVLTLCKI